MQTGNDVIFLLLPFLFPSHLNNFLVVVYSRAATYVSPTHQATDSLILNNEPAAPVPLVSHSRSSSSILFFSFSFSRLPLGLSVIFRLPFPFFPFMFWPFRATANRHQRTQLMACTIQSTDNHLSTISQQQQQQHLVLLLLLLWWWSWWS